MGGRRRRPDRTSCDDFFSLCLVELLIHVSVCGVFCRVAVPRVATMLLSAPAKRQEGGRARCSVLYRDRKGALSPHSTLLWILVWIEGHGSIGEDRLTLPPHPSLALPSCPRGL